MLLQLKVAVLDLDDNNQLHEINQVPGENQVRQSHCIYVLLVVNVQ